MSLHSPTGSALPRPASAASPYRFGKYTLLAKLAQGGMGEVFAALLSGEAGFEKLVVIKRILPHLAEDPRFVSMFLTEARVTASLTHPNICQVFELGQIEGEYYLAMEYLEGASLSRLIRQNANRGLDLRIAGAIVNQALEGLQFAHCFRQPGRGMVGIIHRDMSPSNLFVTSAGLVKVLDFGVAKVSQHAITTSTGLKGKYPYMAPEQIRGLEVDGRADLFSVGVLLFESVTGRSLFHRQSDYETLMAVVTEQRPQASQVRSDIPLGLEEVMDRALRVTREERYASAREMGEALTHAMAGVGGLATSRELADLVRRDCANDLEEERDRIHHATAYLQSMNDRGQKPPDFLNRRPRPIVATPAAEQAAPSESAAPAARSGAAPRIDPAAAMVPTTLESAALPPTRSGSRRNLVAVLLISAAMAAGAAGWWLRGSAEELPPGAEGLAAAVQEPGGAAATAAPSSEQTAGSATEGAGSDGATGRTGDGVAASGDTTVAAGDLARPDAPPGPDGTAAKRAGSERSSRADRESRRRQRARRAAARRASEKAAATTGESGYFSVDAHPYAQIYIDGKLVGITPLVRVPLSPGKHSVRATAESGAEKRFTITVEAGETESRRLQLDIIRP